MTAKISKRNRRIVQNFQNYFDISALFALCSQIYCKQNQNLRKKYHNLCGKLQLFKARFISYQKEQNLLVTGIGMLVACTREGSTILQSFQVDELIMMFKLLSQWKKSIQLCLNFLKETAQKDWKQLKNPIMSHISKYYQFILSILRDIQHKKGKHRSPNKEGFKYKTNNFVEKRKSEQLQMKADNIGQQLTEQQDFLDFVSRDESFTYKANSITLHHKEKKSPVKVSAPKKEQKKEIRSQYASNFKLLSQKSKERVSQGQNSTKITTLHKSRQEQVLNYQLKPQAQDESKNETTKRVMHQKRQGKFVSRHRSTLQTQINLKSYIPKSVFKSSNKLEDVNTFSTNPFETSCQMAHLSNFKDALKSKKTQSKDSISKSRASINVFRKSLVEKLSSKKVSQNKGNIDVFPNQQLQKINESKQNVSQSEHSQQQFVQKTQPNTNIGNEFVSFDKKEEIKNETAEDFCSSKSFKNPKYKRRFGLNNNITKSIRSLDRIQSFLSGDSKKEVRKLKTQQRPSFFRTSGINFQQSKRKSIKIAGSKMSSYKMKLLEKKRKNEDFMNESGEQQKKAEKVPRRFQTEVVQQSICKMDIADIKDYYQILTEINMNEQNSYKNHPQYYYELFKRKYSNHQNIFDFDCNNQAKPFKIKVETDLPHHIVNRPKEKTDVVLFDFMNQIVKTSQTLTLGQRGFAQIL